MRLVIVLIAAVTVLAGCATTVRGSGPPGGAGTVIEQVPAAPPGQLVFQVDVGGGFWQQDYAATARPVLSVYGDGTAYVVADRERRSPGTPVELRRASMSTDALMTLVADAGNSGLFDTGKRDLGDPGITDSGSTLVTFRPGSAPARTVSAYALEYTRTDGDLTDEDKAGRRRLRELISNAEDAVARPQAWTPDRIDVTELRAYSRTSNPQPWPGPALDTVLKGTSYRRCGVVAGAAATRIYETALANGNLHWREGAIVRPLAIRALLPGEKGC